MAVNIQLQTKLNEPSDAALALPFYNLLPKDKVGLLKWRIYVLQRCHTDLEFRDDILEMCRQDIAFFANTFCWLHETRDDGFSEKIGKFPLVLWTDQVDILAWFQQYGGKTCITVEKTRGIGLSWLVIIYLMWKCMFHGELLDYGLLSKDDKSLDLMRRPATLMGKLDLLFETLPGWVQLDAKGKSLLYRTSTDHKFIHKGTENAILGYTSTDDKLRSARFNFLVIDEAAYLAVDTQRWLASSQHTSSSRIFVSTHDGTATMFYRLTTDTKSKLVRISTWWQANPARWAGAYVVKGGIVHYLDKEYKHKPDYEFHFEHPGLERSPWVDSEFEKPGADPVSLMQEIYGTAAIHTKKLIRPEVIDIAERTATPPMYRCRINPYGEFIEDLDGDWHFWQDISLPFTGQYFVGVDPAIGVADRALAGVAAVDAVTGALVATAALATTNTIELARGVELLCQRLCGARGPSFATVIPESTGAAGASFLIELRRLRWTAIYKTGKLDGYHNRDRGDQVLTEAGRAIKDGEFIVSDTRMVDDLAHFEYNNKAEVVFTGDVGHGDLGQAGALAWWAARHRHRSIMEAQDPPSNKDKEPIELEPLYGNSRRRRTWSDRFRMPCSLRY